jgi:hypothetical protein
VCHLNYFKSRQNAKHRQLAYGPPQWENFPMKELSNLISKVARSPWTYLYWAVSGVGTICAHLNTPLNGSPLLGGASIAATLFSLALFYFHLNKLRNELNIPGRRSPLGLFLSIYTFRLRLLLVFSPLIALMIAQGTFGRLASEYLVVSMAAPEQKFGELTAMLPHFWLLLATIVAFIFLDLAGRGQVVAQGAAKSALRRLPGVAKRMALPLVAFTIARIALEISGEYLSFLDYVKLNGQITLALVTALALEPISYGLQMVSVLYLAKCLRTQAPGA